MLIAAESRVIGARPREKDDWGRPVRRHYRLKRLSWNFNPRSGSLARKLCSSCYPRLWISFTRMSRDTISTIGRVGAHDIIADWFSRDRSAMSHVIWQPRRRDFRRIISLILSIYSSIFFVYPSFLLSFYRAAFAHTPSILFYLRFAKYRVDCERANFELKSILFRSKRSFLPNEYASCLFARSRYFVVA